MRIRHLLLLVASFSYAYGEAIGENHGLRFVKEGDQKYLRWLGREGRTYFVQKSLPAGNLSTWEWLPVIRIGNNTQMSFEVEGSSPRAFYRLQFTDQVAINPYQQDYDQDGLSNWSEVSEHQTNPLDWDHDRDRIPDGWEVQYVLDPNDVNDAGLDPDRDGLTNHEEFLNGTNPNDADSDDDQITDGGEVDQGTDPNDPEDTPEAEWFILTGDLATNVEKSRGRVVAVPAGESRIVTVLVASDEYPYYTSGEGTDGDGNPFVFNDLLSWDIRPTGFASLAGEIEVNSRHQTWEQAEDDIRMAQGFYPVHIEDGMTLTASGDEPLLVEIDLAATNIGDDTRPSTVMVGILPVMPVEFFPELMDGNGDPIEGSQTPRLEVGQTNGMVEEDPVANRIAHREISLRIADGGVLEGRTLNWSMVPLFIPPDGGDPVFRGDWADSAAHPNRFETAEHYGAYAYETIDQATARTQIDENGESAIRANLPPIGFNKANLQVSIEGFQGEPADVAHMEVPAVVVIDPGHGGPEGPRNGGSSWNNAVSIGVDPPLSADPQQQGESSEDYYARIGKTLEKDLTLLWGLELQSRLGEEMLASGHDHWRCVMTRSTDVNPTIAARPQVAQNNGADIFFSIHFNGHTNSEIHGPETWIESLSYGNVNHAEDWELAERIQDALDGSIPDAQHPHESGYRGIKEGAVSGVFRDYNLGNQEAQLPHVRACLAELDWITNRNVETSLISGPDAGPNRDVVVEQLAEQIVEDIEHQE